jgi:hypothetical protein
LYAIGVAVLYFNRALLMSPIAKIVAGIVLVIAIIDDLMVAFEGGESVIRDFFLNLLGWDITPFLQGMVASFQEVFGTIRAVLSLFYMTFRTIVSALAFHFQQGLSAIPNMFTTLMNFISTSLNSGIEYFTNFGTNVKTSFFQTVEFVKNLLFTIPNAFKSVWNSVAGMFDFNWLISGIQKAVSSLLTMFQPVIDIYNKVASTVGGATISLPQMPKVQQVQNVNQPMPQQKLNNPMGTVQNQSQNNKSLTQDIKIDIKTNDAKTVAPAISKELNKYMADSKNQFNKGGR